MHDSRQTIVLVEDDARLAASIEEYLSANGYETTVIERGDRAPEAICAGQPSLVILDWMLPGLDGLSICKQLRPRYMGPILMLTARGDPIDEIIGLEVGADDYLAKPVAPRRLLARIRALLRRMNDSGEHAIVEAAGVRVDAVNRSATVDGQPLALTTAEFDLLLYLIRRAGETVTRDALHLELRGIPYDGLDRSIDLRVSRLRAKLLDDPRRPRRIKAVRGIGYIFARSLPR
ncbi:MAG: response regulator [Myxococcota bacterium]